MTADHDRTLNVQFRYLGFPNEDTEFGIIGLFYSDEASARSAATSLQQYFIASPAQKYSCVELHMDSTKGIRLSVEFRWRNASQATEDAFFANISDIEPVDIQRVVDSLRSYSAYGILIGYEAPSGPVLIPPQELAIFRSDLLIDGAKVLATGSLPPPTLWR